jgi:FkbM family methyltransferase
MNRRLKGAIRRLLPRSIGRHVILGGPLRGNLIVASWHDYPAAILGRTEIALLNHFTQIVGKGETWLDIGAHFGYTAIALSKLVGPSGRVFAFEPMLSTAGSIARTRLLNNFPQLTVIPMALANCQDLTIDSLYSERGMIDSTLEERTGFNETFVAARLDWLWPRIGGTDLRIDGIKVDVQGMEIQVLEGMTAVAKKWRPKLCVEIHKGVSRPSLLRVIASMGYKTRALPIRPLPGETEPIYADDQTYEFIAETDDPTLRAL